MEGGAKGYARAHARNPAMYAATWHPAFSLGSKGIDTNISKAAPVRMTGIKKSITKHAAYVLGGRVGVGEAQRCCAR